jgi:hypothetical protein
MAQDNRITRLIVRLLDVFMLILVCVCLYAVLVILVFACYFTWHFFTVGGFESIVFK